MIWLGQQIVNRRKNVENVAERVVDNIKGTMYDQTKIN